MWLWLGIVLVVLSLLQLLYGFAKQHLWLIFGGPGNVLNPFHELARKRKGAAIVTSRRERDKVLKQNFSQEKVPKDLNAIVVGSGIGGLSVAAILAKMGKKVLVLEQHDQAGGCCHTYVEKGFEFDVGIHYIGEMKEGCISRVLIDQLTESGLEWKQLEDVYDTVILGFGEENGDKKRSFPIHSGRKEVVESLKKCFPDEEKAIDKYFDILKQVKSMEVGMAMLKLLPLSISCCLVSSGLILKLFPTLRYFQRSLTDILNEVTDNKELKAVLAYSYGDYGTAPKEAPFGMQALLTNHFAYGGYYPIGGSSEIAFNIIPTIEAAGGRVLVRARVTDIIMDEDYKRVIGVNVKQGHTSYEIIAPMVISDAGIFNTVKSLLPPQAVKKYKLKRSLLSKARPGLALMSVFIGLDGTKEELGLKASNIWAFKDDNHDENLETYLNTDLEDVGRIAPPLMFLSFPSTKDPTYNDRYPGKSTCAIVTVTPYEWFKQWKDEKALHRGDDYEGFKNSIGELMWQQVLEMFPQLEGRREYFEVGSPLSNIFYLNTVKGEVYGADHNLPRFSMEAIANLRPDIGVPGLFLTGQDVLTCGFSGAMHGGLLCAMCITKRNLVDDLTKLTKKVRKELKSKKE